MSFQIERVFQQPGEQNLLVRNLDLGLGHLGHLGLVFRTGNDEKVVFGLLRNGLHPDAAGGLNDVWNKKEFESRAYDDFKRNTLAFST